MAEAGMLSIVRCGTTYQVRYASSNPHDMDRQPYPCPDEGILVALLHHGHRSCLAGVGGSAIPRSRGWRRRRRNYARISA